MVKKSQPRTRPLNDATLARELPVAVGAVGAAGEVAADGLVVVEPALKVVIEPLETADVDVETEPEIVENEAGIVESPPVMVVMWPSEEKVDGAYETMLLPGIVETTEDAELTEVDSMTVGDVAVAGGSGATSEVAADGTGAAEQAAVTVTVW
jgi:hypothetical protein